MHTRRRGFVAFAGVSALAVGLAACGGGGGGGGNNGGGGGNSGGGGTPVRGGTLNMLGSGDVGYMDPNVLYYTISYLGARMWSRGLFAYPAVTGKQSNGLLKSEAPKPDLATQMPSKSNGGISNGGKTYKITIRQGAKWNSKPSRQVTAKDAIRGLKRTCNPVQPFGGTPDFENLIVGYKSFCKGFSKVGQKAPAIKKYIQGHDISGVKVGKNDRTVVYKLSHAAPYFTSMLTLPAFHPAPKEFLQTTPGPEMGNHVNLLISDGPYYVASYTPTKKIVYERNKDWKASTDPIRKAYVNKIVIDETVSQESTQQQLETNSASADMEFDNFPPPSELPKLINTKDSRLNLGPTSSSNPYVVFNLVSPNNNKIMSKTKFRQALEYAMNRKAMVQVLGGPKLNNPLSHILPKSLPAGQHNFDLYPYNPSKAKKMIKSMGASGMTLKFLYRNSSEGSRKTYSVIKNDLTKVGLKVKGITSSNADYYTKYLTQPHTAKSGVFDITLAGWGADWFGTGGALSYFKPLLSGPPSYPPNGSNFGFYNSSKENSIINKAVHAKTAGQAKTLYAQADKQAMKDAVWFPITNPLQPNYHAKQVHNAIYVPAIQNFDPTNVWLAKGKQGG